MNKKCFTWKKNDDDDDDDGDDDSKTPTSVHLLFLFVVQLFRCTRRFNPPPTWRQCCFPGPGADHTLASHVPADDCRDLLGMFTGYYLNKLGQHTEKMEEKHDQLYKWIIFTNVPVQQIIYTR